MSLRNRFTYSSQRGLLFTIRRTMFSYWENHYIVWSNLLGNVIGNLIHLCLGMVILKVTIIILFITRGFLMVLLFIYCSMFMIFSLQQRIYLRFKSWILSLVVNLKWTIWVQQKRFWIWRFSGIDAQMEYYYHKKIILRCLSILVWSSQWVLYLLYTLNF